MSSSSRTSIASDNESNLTPPLPSTCTENPPPVRYRAANERRGAAVTRAYDGNMATSARAVSSSAAATETTPPFNSNSAANGACSEEGEFNDRTGARTQDLRIKSPLLYQLSYPVATDSKVATPGDLDKSPAITD